MTAHEQHWTNYQWSPWIALDSPLEAYREHVPKLPGFYRIRAASIPGLVYIGQTGSSLFGRTRSLKSNVFRELDNPPWNDPHTAAPLLWAYRLEDGLEFEVSVAVADLDYQHRQCMEDALLYQHRLEHGHSTLCNHGRAHPWWTRPSNRNAGRETEKRCYRPEEFPSLPPAQGGGDYLSDDWLGLEWSPFAPLTVMVSAVAGVYRIAHARELLYLGESQLFRTRFTSHANDPRFQEADVSFHEMLDPYPHQLKEREVDLIGAYFLAAGKPPVWQYRSHGP